MIPINPIYFVDGGIQWITERWEVNGVVCCENTHPVYDQDGMPIQA